MSDLKGIAANLRAEGWDLRANAIENAADRIAELQAENERLREALQRVVKENADIHCEEIALAALEDK